MPILVREKVISFWMIYSVMEWNRDCLSVHQAHLTTVTILKTQESDVAVSVGYIVVETGPRIDPLPLDNACTYSSLLPYACLVVSRALGRR